MAFKIIAKKVNYRGMWADLVQTDIRLPDGRLVKWENIITDDIVVVVALDKDKKIYLSKEWRSAWEKEVVQIPAGMCRAKTAAGALRQARYELREEIGLDAKEWQKLITYPSGGRQKSKIHIFLAQDLYPSAKRPDDGETIEIVKMPFARAYRDFLSGKIPTVGYTLVGLAIAKERLKL